MLQGFLRLRSRRIKSASSFNHFQEVKMSIKYKPTGLITGTRWAGGSPQLGQHWARLPGLVSDSKHSKPTGTCGAFRKVRPVHFTKTIFYSLYVCKSMKAHSHHPPCHTTFLPVIFQGTPTFYPLATSRYSADALKQASFDWVKLAKTGSVISSHLCYFTSQLKIKLCQSLANKRVFPKADS